MVGYGRDVLESGWALGLLGLACECSEVVVARVSPAIEQVVCGILGLDQQQHERLRVAIWVAVTLEPHDDVWVTEQAGERKRYL